MHCCLGFQGIIAALQVPAPYMPCTACPHSGDNERRAHSTKQERAGLESLSTAPGEIRSFKVSRFYPIK
jgi:hypothetical protein